ncbi:MAG: exodeoxyribonuclease VII small subunit [Nitrospiraceae bacterium]|nr:exodeoxyribonuclease VII small subunit [Nitrospiraceae bacterium]
MAEPKFENDLEKLERVVEALETGGLSLDDALKRFEEGIKLARRCEKALAAAEKKIEMLTKDAKGNIVAEPFGGEDEGNDAPVSEPESADDDDEGDLLF